jgi:hypothetical protein
MSLRRTDPTSRARSQISISSAHLSGTKNRSAAAFCCDAPSWRRSTRSASSSPLGRRRLAAARDLDGQDDLDDEAGDAAHNQKSQENEVHQTAAGLGRFMVGAAGVPRSSSSARCRPGACSSWGRAPRGGLGHLIAAAPAGPLARRRGAVPAAEVAIGLEPARALRRAVAPRRCGGPDRAPASRRRPAPGPRRRGRRVGRLACSSRRG